jgi:hypothetical protein
MNAVSGTYALNLREDSCINSAATPDHSILQFAEVLAPYPSSRSTTVSITLFHISRTRSVPWAHLTFLTLARHVWYPQQSGPGLEKLELRGTFEGS